MENEKKMVTFDEKFATTLMPLMMEGINKAILDIQESRSKIKEILSPTPDEWKLVDLNILVNVISQIMGSMVNAVPHRENYREREYISICEFIAEMLTTEVKDIIFKQIIPSTSIQ